MKPTPPKRRALTKKMTVDEMTRLAFIYAEQDREGLLNAYQGCTRRVDVAFKNDLRELIKRMRNYRVKRWGRTQFDEIIENSNLVSITDLKSRL